MQTWLILLCTVVPPFLCYIVWRLLLSDDGIPSPDYEKYKYPHENGAVYGSNVAFEKKGTMTVNGRSLRSYITTPKSRIGNGFANPDQPIGVLIFCHAYFSHMDNCAGLADYLSSLGFVTCGIDYPGNGESEGEPGYLDNIDDVITDIVAFAHTMRSTRFNSNIPFFVGGYSLGANFAIGVSLRNPSMWSGMLLLSPILTLTYQPRTCSLARLLVRIAPRCRVLGFPLDMVSRNVAFVQYLTSDSRNHLNRPLYVNTIVELQKLIQFVNDNNADITVPFMISHGQEDLISDVTACRRFVKAANRISSSNKRLLYLTRCWHATLNEAESEDLIPACADFLEDLLKSMYLRTTLD